MLARMIPNIVLTQICKSPVLDVQLVMRNINQAIQQIAGFQSTQKIAISSVPTFGAELNVTAIKTYHLTTLKTV